MFLLFSIFKFKCISQFMKTILIEINTIRIYTLLLTRTKFIYLGCVKFDSFGDDEITKGV